MLKKSKTYLAILLALIISVTTILPAFAAEPEPDPKGDPIISESENEQLEAVITKNLRLPVGTDIPNATFIFDVERKTVDDVPWDGTNDHMPPLNSNLTLTFGEDNERPGKTEGNIVSFIMETEDIFKGVTFPHAGIFVYEITERVTDVNPLIDGSDFEWLYYSNAKYTLTVHVNNHSDGIGTYIHALGTKVTIVDPGTEHEVGQKVDPTPGGDKEFYFWSQMIFTNDYVKINEPGENGNDDSTLEIKKIVDGDLGNKSMLFDFQVTLTLPVIFQNGTPSYVGTVIGGDTPRTYDIPVNEATSFQLKHGESLVFYDLPVGTTFIVREQLEELYESRFVVTTADAQVGGSCKIDGAEGWLSTGNQLVGEFDNLTEFTNTRDGLAPMGLNINNLPFIVTIVLGMAGLVAYMKVKTRKRVF